MIVAFDAICWAEMHPSPNPDGPPIVTVRSTDPSVPIVRLTYAQALQLRRSLLTQLGRLEP